MSFMPAGSEFESDSEGEDYYERHTPKMPVKTPIELKKERLLQVLQEKDLNGIKQELDHGLPKGLDIDEAIDRNWNLLFHACSLGLPDIVQFLVDERGSFVNLEVDAETPIMVACHSEADSPDVLKIVRVLIENAANFRMTDAYGVTSLMKACSRGHAEAVKYLIAKKDSINTIDNEKRNALFHAIEGKHVEIAKILIDAGIDLNVVNTFGASARDLAIAEMQNEILALMPLEKEQPFQLPINFTSYNRFEDLIPDESSDVPPYFPDVDMMLVGMNCAKFINNFALAKVSLEEFLSISDKRLEEIGIKFPFQRNIIKLGLMNFHKHEWSNLSHYVPLKFDEDLSSIDLTLMLANLLRQATVIKAGLVYLKNLSKETDIRLDGDYISMDNFNELKRNVKELKKLLKQKAAQEPKSSPLLITKKKSSNLKRAIEFAVFAATIAFGAVFLAFKN